MTLRLTVDRQAWLDHVRTTAGEHGAALPVVKGNGYGFGRPILLEQAGTISDHVAVGTVFEATVVPTTLTPVVLTPVGDSIPNTLSPHAILTVGSQAHIATLSKHGWRGNVVVKLQSTMQRFGAPATELATIKHACAQASLNIVGWSIHPPLSPSGENRSGEVSCWMELLHDSLPIFVSHLTGAQMSTLRTQFPQRQFVSRIGTALWLGDKTMIRLSTEVLDLHRVEGGTAGYRSAPLNGNGHIVVVGAGTAHGVYEIPQVGSPFHFAQQRLQLVEHPYMHSSMLFIPDGDLVPRVGDAIDVQQAMTRVFPDNITWM